MNQPRYSIGSVPLKRLQVSMEGCDGRCSALRNRSGAAFKRVRANVTCRKNFAGPFRLMVSADIHKYPASVRIRFLRGFQISIVDLFKCLSTFDARETQREECMPVAIYPAEC